MGKRKHTFVILSIAMILVIVGIIEIFFTPQVEIDIEADRSIAVDLFYDNGQIGEYSFDDQHLSNQQGSRRTRVVGTFPDGNSALMLVCTRLRHVAGTQWGNKKYMNMKHLETALDDAFIAG